MTARRNKALKANHEIFEEIRMFKDLPASAYEAVQEKLDADFIASMARFEVDLISETDIPILPDHAAENNISTVGTRSITIRMPRIILAEFKKLAKSTGVPYQTLMIRELRKASATLA